MFKAIKGMNDILPNESKAWLWLEEVLRNWLVSFGYENMRTPIVEQRDLYVRSIGAVTDIVEKEMYTWVDHLNGDTLALRPEGTAGTLRAVAEHNLLYNGMQKLWYIGAMFRHERPQKGRYRQFHQLSVEALGIASPTIDCEIIAMVDNLWQRLGLNDIELHINCLGNKDERLAHRAQLIAYLEQHLDLLDEDARRRLYTNPLRVLDSKNPHLQELVEQAPKLIDYLGEKSYRHYSEWKLLLDSLNIKYKENPRLVRGLDYYNLSVFEWMSNSLGAQATVVAGGRYDPLVSDFIGRDSYGVGFAIGVERLLLILADAGKIPATNIYDIYIAQLCTDSDATNFLAVNAYAMKIAQDLRTLGVNVLQDFSYSSLKAQLKRANNLNVTLTVIIGENEVKNSQLVVKFMHEHQERLLSFEQLQDTVMKTFNVAQ